MNHNYFAVALVFLAGVLGYFSQQLTGQNLQIMAVKTINASLLTSISLAFVYFTRGTRYDVIKEIFDEKNIAGALYIGLFMLALSVCLTVVS
jgi:hypothetical protein